MLGIPGCLRRHLAQPTKIEFSRFIGDVRNRLLKLLATLFARLPFGILPPADVIPEGNAIAAGLFGRHERLFGRIEQVIHVAPCEREAGEPDADIREGHAPMFRTRIVMERVSNPLGQDLRVVVRRFGQGHAEDIGIESCGEIDLADRMLHDVSHFAQGLVTGGVAVFGVVLSELIQIDHQERQRCLIAMGLLDHLSKQLEEAALVIESGQFIADAPLLERGLCRRQLLVELMSFQELMDEETKEWRIDVFQTTIFQDESLCVTSVFRKLGPFFDNGHHWDVWRQQMFLLRGATAIVDDEIDGVWETLPIELIRLLQINGGIRGLQRIGESRKEIVVRRDAEDGQWFHNHGVIYKKGRALWQAEIHFLRVDAWDDAH